MWTRQNIHINMIVLFLFKANLEGYIGQILEAIVHSRLSCPVIMCEAFYALKEAALKQFPGVLYIIIIIIYI